MSLSELQAIRDEISTCATILARVDNRLTNLVRQNEQEHESRQQAFAEAERERAQLANSVQWLSHQRDEVERKFAQQKPDLDRATDAREAAIRKLRYTRKVIRDLVDENERVASKFPSKLTEGEEREEMKRALEDAMAISVSSSSSASDSEGTARQRRSPLPAPSPIIDSERKHRPTETSKAGGSLSTVSPKLPQTVPSSAESSSESVHPALPQFSGADLDDVLEKYDWSIHYSSPPGSSDMSLGPVGSSRLLEHMITGTATIGYLERLRTRSDFCLRLHTDRDLAFLYDPIFLEGRSEDSKKTYILDWGVEKANQSLEAYIRHNQTTLHTFVFPTERKQWFYVGAHTWKVADLPSIWPSLATKSKRKVVRRLFERNHEEYDEKTITAAFESGELRQLCIEISSEGHWEKSRSLAQKMGYKAPRAR